MSLSFEKTVVLHTGHHLLSSSYPSTILASRQLTTLWISAFGVQFSYVNDGYSETVECKAGRVASAIRRAFYIKVSEFMKPEVQVYLMRVLIYTSSVKSLVFQRDIAVLETFNGNTPERSEGCATHPIWNIFMSYML